MLAHRLKRNGGVSCWLFRLCIALLSAALLPLWPLASLPAASAESSLTIDTPADGEDVDVGTITVSGRYSEAYAIKLIVGGTEQLDTRMEGKAARNRAHGLPNWTQAGMTGDHSGRQRNEQHYPLWRDQRPRRHHRKQSGRGEAGRDHHQPARRGEGQRFRHDGSSLCCLPKPVDESGGEN